MTLFIFLLDIFGSLIYEFPLLVLPSFSPLRLVPSRISSYIEIVVCIFVKTVSGLSTSPLIVFRGIWIKKSLSSLKIYSNIIFCTLRLYFRCPDSGLPATLRVGDTVQVGIDFFLLYIVSQSS